MRFKVGAQVRFIGECAFIKKGWVGDVVSFDESSGSPQYEVNFGDTDLLDTWTCDKHELELVA
jgi:hypothetical protein